ncbi:lantibiotic dehydratase [Streptomyces anulatus]|uniref:lantibiotic dehydratase n=1 Tax=Streptomyces anulatus TaxID=1892 RepID=UPI003F49E8FD
MVASAGAEWLADIVDRLVADPGVCRRLSLVVNNAVRVSCDRVTVPWRRRRSGGRPRRPGDGLVPGPVRRPHLAAAGIGPPRRCALGSPAGPGRGQLSA